MSEQEPRPGRAPSHDTAEEAVTVRRPATAPLPEAGAEPTWQSSSGPRGGEAPSLTPGYCLAGRYTILEPLGQGGMGVVLAAYDARLDRRVALKLLRQREGSRGGGDDDSRLAREAQAMARLNHPNVVAVYDSGTLADGSLFIAMEYVQGQTLRHWRRQPRTWRQVLEAYLSAGRGLAAAHAAGLIHRDFKPDNVLVGEDGRVRVTDFGLARARTTPDADPPPPSAVEPAPSSGSSSSWGSALTVPGTFMGTPGYMAPELLRGQPAEVRSDVFAFCAALYEALYGQLPFRGASPTDITRAQLHGEVATPPAASEVPAWVTHIVLRGLSSDPLQRPASVEELLAALGNDPEIKRRALLRRGALASVVVALAGLALWGWARQSAHARGCDQMEQQLANIWDEPVKAKIQQAMLGTGLSYAPDTFRRVSSVLGGYAAQWVKQRTEVCEAAVRQPTQQQGLGVLREYCLERRRSQLRALTELFSRGSDPELMAKAVQAAQALPPLEYCADVHALTAAVPPPEDPAARAQVDALQEQVDRLEALYEASKYAEGLALSVELLKQVEAVGHAPLQARALYLTGRLREGSGDYPGAEQTMRETIPLAARGKDLAVLTLAWGRLAYLVGAGQSRPQEAAPLVPMVETVAELADDDLSRAFAHHALGAVLRSMGKYEEARERFERATALREKVLGPEHIDVAHSLGNMGVILMDLGRAEESLRVHERALALREKALGPEHPVVATGLSNMGLALEELGRYEEARRNHERALAIKEKVLGADHPDVTQPLTNLANVLDEMGQDEESLRLHERALAIKEKRLAPEDADIALSVANVGVVLQRMGRFKEAQLRHERALPMMEKALGKEHPFVATTLTNLGMVLRHQGRLAEARLRYERALALTEKALGREHPDLSTALIGLGELAMDQGRLSEALPLLERAVKLSLETDRPNARFALAQALWKAKRDRPRAIALATEAQALWKHRGESTHLNDVTQWLATHSKP